MSESDQDKEILRLALKSDAQRQGIDVKEILRESELNISGVPYSKSYQSLESYEQELSQEAHRILEKAWGTKQMSDEDKEILRRSSQASITLQSMRRRHISAWHGTSVILLIVLGILFLVFVVESLQNMWLRTLSAGVTIFLTFVLPILLSTLFWEKVEKKRKALAIRVVRLYLVEKWTHFDIAKELGISQRQVHKILQNYIVELDAL